MLKIRKMEMDPPSGWVFKAETGMIIQEGTFEKLLRSVRRHLEVNGYHVPDNIREVVMHQICLNNPESICQGEGPKRFFPTAREVENGTKKLLAARREIVAAGEDAFVSQEEADARAQQCVSCPMKRNLWGCFLCTELVKLVVGSFGRVTPYDDLARACGVCGCINAAQVHLQGFVLAKTASAASISDYPETDCWKRKALEAHYGRCGGDDITRRDGSDDSGGEASAQPAQPPSAGTGPVPETQAGELRAGSPEGQAQEPVGREPPVRPAEPPAPGA